MSVNKIVKELRAEIDSNQIVILPTKVLMQELAEALALRSGYTMRHVGLFCMKGRRDTGYGITLLVESLQDEDAIARLKGYLMGNADQHITLLDGCRMSDAGRQEAECMAKAFRCTFRVLKVAE